MQDMWIRLFQPTTRQGACYCLRFHLKKKKKGKIKSAMGHIFEPLFLNLNCNLLWRKLVLSQYIIITRLLHNGVKNKKTQPSLYREMWLWCIIHRVSRCVRLQWVRPQRSCWGSRRSWSKKPETWRGESGSCSHTAWDLEPVRAETLGWGDMSRYFWS